MNARLLFQLRDRKAHIEKQIRLVTLMVKYPPPGCSQPVVWREVNQKLLRELENTRDNLAVEICRMEEQAELAFV